jgi:hypothetical protein
MNGTILAFSLALLFAGCATTQVPEALKPEANQKLALVVHARGEQIYECRERTDQARLRLAFVAPQAGLSDRTGGRSAALRGLSWEVPTAASRGKVSSARRRSRGHSVAAAGRKSAGRDGTFSKFTSVQAWLRRQWRPRTAAPSPVTAWKFSHGGLLLLREVNPRQRAECAAIGGWSRGR